MKKPRPCVARWGQHDLTEVPAMSNRSSLSFKPSRHRGQAPGPCWGHQLSSIQSSAGQQSVSVRFVQQSVSVHFALIFSVKYEPTPIIACRHRLSLADTDYRLN